MEPFSNFFFYKHLENKVAKKIVQHSEKLDFTKTDLCRCKASRTILMMPRNFKDHSDEFQG